MKFSYVELVVIVRPILRANSTRTLMKLMLHYLIRETEAASDPYSAVRKQLIRTELAQREYDEDIRSWLVGLKGVRHFEKFLHPEKRIFAKGESDRELLQSILAKAETKLEREVIQFLLDILD